MSYPRNNASPERIAVGAVVQISDGAVQSSGVSISVRGQGGASGAGAGTTAYDNGIVQYTPTQGETDFTSFVVVAYKTGCIPASVTVVTSASGTPGVVVVPSTQKVDVETIKTQTVTCVAGVTVSPYVGATGAAINGTNANTLSGHDPGATLGTSTLTQAQVTGGAYALNHASFAFNAALDFTTTQKAATLARVTLVDTTTTNTDMRGTDSAALAATALSTATWTATRAGYLDNLSGGAVMLASSYSAPPSAATISTQVASDLAAAHGAGSWATATGFSTLDAAGVRTAVGLATANLDTQLEDLPTVAEFEARTIVAASYGTAANQSTIAGYIDTEVAAILAAVDTEVGAIKAKTDQLVFTVANQVDSNALSGGGSGLDAAGVRAAIGMSVANLDTQLADIPTVAEFNARTLAAAAYFDPGTDTVTTTDVASIASILADTNELQGDWANNGRLDLILDARASQASVDDVPTNAELATALAGADDAVLSAIAALNNLSAAQVNTECDTALTDAGVTTARMAALADWIDGGRLDLILDAILDDTGTAGVALSAAICNKVADHVRRRTQANVEASSDGDALSLLSEYGAIQQIQQSAASGATLTVKKTDATTTLGTRTLATNAGSDPVTGVS